MKYEDVVRTDDIGGEDGAITVEFSLDGVDYEIDLVTWRAQLLRAALGPYIARARTDAKPGGRAGHRRRMAIQAARELNVRDMAHPSEIRAWALQEGVITPEQNVSHRVKREFYRRTGRAS